MGLYNYGQAESALQPARCKISGTENYTHFLINKLEFERLINQTKTLPSITFFVEATFMDSKQLLERWKITGNFNFPPIKIRTEIALSDFL